MHGSVGHWELCPSPGTEAACAHLSLLRAWPTPPGQHAVCESHAGSLCADPDAAHFADGAFGRHCDADRAPLPRHSPPDGRILTLSRQ